jgi:hypothetical protein
MKCELEVDDLTLKEMADLCRELAMNPRADSVTQCEALQLMTEAAEIQGPPEYKQRPEYARALRIRMAYLLTQELQFLLAPQALKTSA